MSEKAPIKFSFTKAERLKSKKVIEELFKNGSSFFTHPFLVKYIPADDLESHQIVITVPKKHIKSAVRRNKIKRRIREAYRLQKHLYTYPQFFYIAILYLSKEDIGYKKTENKLKFILSRLSTTAEQEKTDL